MKIKCVKENKDIGQYDSIVDAAKAYNVNESSIRRALNNPNRTSCGMHWVTCDEEEEVEEKVTVLGDISNVDDSLKYDFLQGEYSWTSKGEKFVLTLELADKLFFGFSRHGLNLSSNAVRYKNNLSLRMWHSAKNRLQLYKDSDIFSPETRKGLSDKEYRELAASKIRELDAHKKKAVLDEYHKHLEKNYKKWRDIANKKTFAQEQILSELSDWLDSKKQDVVTIAVNPKAAPKELVAASADWHMGAKTKDRYNTPDYNPNVTLALANAFADEVNGENASEVSLMFLGDYIETWMGLNHPNSWQGIEVGHYGAEVIKRAIEMFEVIIAKVANVKRVIGIGGNHDRATNSNKEDVESQLATLIFYMLDRLYGNKIEFIYDPFCVEVDIDNIHYILQHGNTGSSKKSEGLINDYGNIGMFNMILTADRHTRGVLMDGWNRRHLQVPPMFIGNLYSTHLGFSSVSGCLKMNNNGTGLPRVTDESFYSKMNAEEFNKNK